MIRVDQRESVPTAHWVHGQSMRQIARETEHCRKVIRTVSRGLEPQIRLQEAMARQRVDPIVAVLKGW
jgi:hypothetical protein